MGEFEGEENTFCRKQRFFPPQEIFRECPAYTLLSKFSPKNTGQSKVKQPHKIDKVTIVASAQAPKSLQPGKCPFHYPVVGRIAPAFTDFFPPAADLLLKSINIDFPADSWIIIPLVQTEVSHFSPQKLAAHFPRVFQGCSYQVAVMHIGTCGCHSQRNTLTVHMEMNLAATSSSACRVASRPLSRCFLRMRRRLQQGASIACHWASTPTFSPYSIRSMRKISVMTPTLLQRWKCSWTELFEP